MIKWGRFKAHILVACICEYNHRKAAQSRNSSSPSENTDRASIRHGIPLQEVVKNKNDKITDRCQGNDGSVFQGIKAS